MPNPLTKTINSFFGVRNTSPARSIPDNALTAATDVDIDDAGILTRRRGYVSSKSIPNITSTYTTRDGVSYVVADGQISRLDDGLNLHTLAPSTANCFCDLGANLFTNDGLRIQNDEVTDLATLVALVGPTMTDAPGTWPAGTYSAVFTYHKAPMGLEGATSPTSSITIEEGRCVFAVAPVVAGYVATIYMTDADGTVYYDSTGAALNPALLINDPITLGGSALAIFESSLYVATPLANGSTYIGFSLPYLYHLYDSMTKYIIVPGEVRAMMSVTGGLIIATDAAIFVWDGTVLVTLAPYGVPRGRSITLSPDDKAKIWTYRGVCEALPFANLTESKASFPAGKLCSTALVDHDGVQQFIALTDGSGTAYNSRS